MATDVVEGEVEGTAVPVVEILLVEFIEVDGSVEEETVAVVTDEETEV